MMKRQVVFLCAAITAAALSNWTEARAALKEDPVTGRFGPVKVVSKKAWRSNSLRGFIVSYKVDGKTYRGAKVHCISSSGPAYLIENLDRGDGMKVDIDVGTEDGTGVLATLAPGYMNWSIDLWLQTCR